jgi:hypothetical protein
MGGRGFLTVKWSHRIAQSFSPGWTSPKTALKVATEWGVCSQHSNTPSLRVAGFEDEEDAEDENEAP